jgi:hypothetical protein
MGPSGCVLLMLDRLMLEIFLCGMTGCPRCFSQEDGDERHEFWKARSDFCNSSGAELKAREAR